MNQGILAELKKNKWLVRGAIALGVGLLILLIVSIVISLTPRTSYEMTPLGAPKGTASMQLSGDKLYSYNGSAFLASNITNNEQVEVLHPGLKLPIADKVVFADNKGALMHFNAGFSYTEVERYLEDNDMSLFSDYTDNLWYVDFSDGSIHLVTTDPLLAEPVHYSKGENGFYMALDTGTMSPHSLAFYSVKDKELTFVESMPKLRFVTHISNCFDNKATCVTGTGVNLSDKPTVYRIDSKSGEFEDIVSSSGFIIPTGHPDIYIIRDEVDEANSNDHDNDDHIDHGGHTHDRDIDYTLKPAQLYNIATEQYSNAGVEFELDSVNTLVNQSGQDFAYITPDSTNTLTSRAKNLLGTFSSSTQTIDLAGDASDYPGNLSVLHYGGTDRLLAQGSDATLYIVAPTGTVQDGLKSIGTDAAESTLESCSASMSDFEVVTDTDEIRVFLEAGGGFLDRVKQSAKCLADTPEIHTSFSVSYRGISPDNGRVIIN